MTGHVFVMRGDLTRFACDAWMLPTDNRFSITDIWASSIGRSAGPLEDQAPWGANERVRPWPHTAGDPRIWLADIGRSGAPMSWYVNGVEAFVREAAAALPTRPGRPPLLAINHVGTGRGGAAFTRGELLVALFERLYSLVGELDVDIAVVSWDARAYAAAQRARMATFHPSSVNALEAAIEGWAFESSERTEVLQTTARNLGEHIREQRLALFIGAGVSAGAGLPGWRGLLEQLGASLESPLSPHDLSLLADDRDRAALLEKRFKVEQRTLGAELALQLSSSRYSLQHGLLSSMSINEITTTNFDELFETAATTDGRTLKVIPGESIDDGNRWLLKLHGTLSDPESLVFTRSAYLDAPRQRGALFGLVQAMLMTRHMLFVGYGLADEDFHDLVHEVRWAQPETRQDAALGTAVTLFDDPVRAELWHGDLEVVAMHAEPHSRNENGSPTAAAVAAAGRDVERFLDLVGLIATDRSAFILDPEYRGMLSPSEKALAELLQELPSSIASHVERDGWKEVANLLRRLGSGLHDETL